MNKSFGITFLSIVLLFSCKTKNDVNNACNEIRATEAAFEKTAQEKGIAEAFYQYAAEDATIDRGKLIHGRVAIREFYVTAKMETAQLSWSPDSVFVSKSADMGYTYGKYKLVEKDSVGRSITKEVIFHTVWKRQKDGSWKYVWD